MNSKNIGDFGENAVCEYLMKKAYEIKVRNYHTRYGEIDIIAEKEEAVFFVEVKTRKSNRFGNASEFVDKRKQEKIIQTAYCYLGENLDKEIHFDVAEVYYYESGNGMYVKNINYIKNAFICEE